MTPSFSDITYFLEVAETLNITRAAGRLGVTQPTLSAAIKRLEATLDIALLLRNKTGVQLTKAGSEFVAKSRLLLLNWEQIKADVLNKRDAVSGAYIIGCHPSVALYSLSGFLPKLISKYPDLNIRLVHDLSRKITESVINFETDFGIVVNPIKHPELVLKQLCTDEVTFWESKKPSSIQKERSVLICDPSLLQSQALLSHIAKKNLSFSRYIESSNLEVITDLTASGAGIGLLPARVATRIAANQLVKVDSAWPSFKDKI